MTRHVAREEQDDVRDLFGRAGFPGQRLISFRILDRDDDFFEQGVIAIRRVIDVRVDGPRANRVDANAELGELGCCHFGESGLAGFRRRIAAEPKVFEVTVSVDRRRDDDTAASFF